MSRGRATPLNSQFRVLFRILPTSSANAKLRNWSITEGINSRQFVSSFHSCIPSKPISYFLSKSILFGNSTLRTLPPVSENPNVFHLRWFSSSSNEQSFTVSYLINSVGLSPQTALAVSKHVNFETCEKPDKVVNLFRKYGFAETQLSSLFRKRPELLVADMEKTILPKLEFFEAKGFSRPEIAKMLSVFPTVLTSSLDKQIVPSYDFFRNLFETNKKLNGAVKRCPDILVCKNFGRPSIDLLRGCGVPDSSIATLVLYEPRILRFSLNRLRETVSKVVEMGFDPSKVNFVLAVRGLWSMSKSTWESKVDAYKKWGWSEDEVLKAFERSPWCMMLSEDKITTNMDFFINQMGSRHCLIVKRPKLLSLSLKKRLIPRSLFFQALLTRGLVKEEVSLAALFDCSEKVFLQKFVERYKKEAPELLKLYKEKLNLSNGELVDKV